MDHVSAVQFRKEIALYLDRAKYRGERIVIHRRGRDAAALVPLEDLALLEKARRPSAASRKAPRGRRGTGQGTGLGLDELRRELGL